MQDGLQGQAEVKRKQCLSCVHHFCSVLNYWATEFVFCDCLPHSSPIRWEILVRSICSSWQILSQQILIRSIPLLNQSGNQETKPKSHVSLACTFRRAPSQTSIPWSLAQKYHLRAALTPEPCKVQPHRGSGKPQVHCTLTAQGRLGLSFGQTNWKRQVMREWGPASRCVGAPEPGLGSHKAQRGLSCCSSEKASCWVSLPLWAGPLGAAATQLAKCLCGRRWQQSPWLFQDAPTRDSRGGQASA